MRFLSATGAARRLAVSALAVAAGLCLVASPTAAQSVTDSFAGFSTSSNEPINIESDTLEVRDAEKIAIFRGNVMAEQSGMTLRARELLVNYTGDDEQSGSGGSQITKITAEGKVLIVTDSEQTATSDWANFDVASQTVVIGGNVVLSQGENVIKGDRLVIDLTTGRSRFENEGQPAAGQRVRGLFKPRKSGEDPARRAADTGPPLPAGGTAAPPP